MDQAVTGVGNRGGNLRYSVKESLPEEVALELWVRWLASTGIRRERVNQSSEVYHVLKEQQKRGSLWLKHSKQGGVWCGRGPSAHPLSCRCRSECGLPAGALEPTHFSFPKPSLLIYHTCLLSALSLWSFQSVCKHAHDTNTWEHIPLFPPGSRPIQTSETESTVLTPLTLQYIPSPSVKDVFIPILDQAAFSNVKRDLHSTCSPNHTGLRWPWPSPELLSPFL